MLVRTMVVVLVSLSSIALLPTGLEAQVVYDGKPLDYWVEQIEAGNYYGGAYKAFEQLACSAAPAVPRLLDLIKNPKHQTEAAAALGAIGHASALPPLTQRLANSDRYDRLYACAAIGGIVAAETGKGRTRCSGSAVKLSETVGPTIQPLIKLLPDNDSNVAGCAHRALAGMGAASVPNLVAAVKDSTESTQVRAAAARVLGMIGPAAIDALPTLKALVSRSTEDALIRGEANAAVLKIERREP